MSWDICDILGKDIGDPFHKVGLVMSSFGEQTVELPVILDAMTGRP